MFVFPSRPLIRSNTSTFLQATAAASLDHTSCHSIPFPNSDSVWVVAPRHWLPVTGGVPRASLPDWACAMWWCETQVRGAHIRIELGRSRISDLECGNNGPPAGDSGAWWGYASIDQVRSRGHNARIRPGLAPLTKWRPHPCSSADPHLHTVYTLDYTSKLAHMGALRYAGSYFMHNWGLDVL